jgi:aquaporin Z
MRGLVIRHWPEYAIEAGLLGLFMVSACAFTVLLEHPASPAHRALSDPLVRRMLMGAAMGATAIGLIYSPWGRQSGAHMNPSLTLTFLRLGKVAPRDAAAYVGAQFAGGASGILLVLLVLGMLAGDPAVRFAATAPGPAGAAVAFVAEAAISFGMMAMVLFASNSRRAAPFTGLFAGMLVATYITVEAPLSGMSMNPARTFASALGAASWQALWVYFTAPLLGMLAAAEVYVRLRGQDRVLCAKMNHETRRRCIFRCRYGEVS